VSQVSENARSRREAKWHDGPEAAEKREGKDVHWIKGGKAGEEAGREDDENINRGEGSRRAWQST